VNTIPLERLRECLIYDPASGRFWWKIQVASRPASSPAGTRNSLGYIRIKIDGVSLGASRAAWALMTGEWPERDIDHEDRDKGNNRWGNLRLATDAQNKANSKLDRRNTAGLKGAVYIAKRRRWRAQIIIGGKAWHLGYFGRPEEAHAAYMAAAIEAYGDFARAQ
jgi:HNH endonuclease